MMSNGLSTIGVTAGYHRAGKPIPVVRDVNISIGPGELVCLLGVNGAGKSTLLRTLTGMQAPLAGHIALEGRDLVPMSPIERARRLAVVFTDRVDVPLMYAEQIVALGRSPYQGWISASSSRDRLIVEQSMARVGASGLAGRLISELSDGEKQRVMLARALAQEPKVLILDEPLAFLDLVRRVELVSVLRALANEGLAVLLSIHDVEIALRIADLVWIINADGTLSQGGPEDLALSGKIDATFANDLVAFDHLTGAFQAVPEPATQRATVRASGSSAIWACRALERAGFAIADGPSQITLAARCDGGWELTAREQATVLPDLRQVVAELRQR